MSLPGRPSFQKPTKSSSSSSSSAGGGGGAPGGRWNGNYSAGVSPVRGLSPVRSNVHGVARQDMDMGRSHTNPLFTTRSSHTSRLNSTPTKACKDFKENRDKQDPWKVPSEKAQYSTKTLCTTPGKSTRTTATMRFTTPPKPLVKRKILAENRELTTGPPPRMMKAEDEMKPFAANTPKKDVVPDTGNVSQHRYDESQSLSPERNLGEASKPKSPLVSIEDLQKRIQKFLQDEEPLPDVSVPMSPRQSNESIGRVPMSPRQSTESLGRFPISPRHSTESLGSRLNGSASEESSLTGVEEVPFQPVVAPYSPRPEFLRARKSPTPVPMEGNVSPLHGEEESLIQEMTTSAYDPKNNFLSPRPQFLRYRPLRRLELLRKSAEGTLADLDLESPATDAESSRMGSEQDEKEGSESQDVSQEIQSLKSSLEEIPSQEVSQEVQSLRSSLEETPPRCKKSGHDLFQSVQVIEEIKPLSMGDDPMQSIFSTAPAAEPEKVLDVASTRLEFEGTTEGNEEELEDSDSSNKSSAWYNAFCIVTVCALITLFVVSSGSQSLLPTSLHQNHISHFWKTSKVTEPIRHFLQTTEGLWTENPHERDFTLSSPNIVRVGWVHVWSLAQAVDVSEVRKNVEVLLSSTVEYCARLGRLTKESLVNFKASLEEEMNFYSSHRQEANEWDWVPDYEFVVPHDIFDPVKTYENIMARLESWELKSLWTSLIQSSAKHPFAQLVGKELTDQTLDSSNSSLCSLSASPDNPGVLYFSPVAPGRVIADMPTSPSQDIQLNSDSKQSEEQTIYDPHKLDFVSGDVQESLLSFHDDQELGLGNVVTEQGTPDFIAFVAENTADVILELESSSILKEEEIPLPLADEVVQLPHKVEERQPGSAVEDFQVMERVLIQDESLQESLLEKNILRLDVTEALPDPSGLEENDMDSHAPQETKVETPRSIVQELMHASGLWTTAGFSAPLLLAAGVALLVLHKLNARSGKGHPGANLEASAPTFSEPPSKEAYRVQPLEQNTGSDFWFEDSSAVQLSSDYVSRYSTSSINTVGNPDRMLGNFTRKPLTPEKYFQHITDEELFQRSDMAIVPESSLGRFTTLVPVIHKEGTASERVQLTPVKRSSRIRTRMQNSPCHLMHSPHLCNC